MGVGDALGEGDGLPLAEEFDPLDWEKLTEARKAINNKVNAHIFDALKYFFHRFIS